MGEGVEVGVKGGLCELRAAHPTPVQLRHRRRQRLCHADVVHRSVHLAHVQQLLSERRALEGKAPAESRGQRR
eukprot:359666-Chlamydomonas_euryale.AAC.4